MFCWPVIKLYWFCWQYVIMFSWKMWSSVKLVKGTLMQIWKFHFILEFIQKQCPENFASLNLRTLSYFPVKFLFFLKSRLIFKRFYCLCMFLNKHFIKTGAYISKSKRCWNAKLSVYYLYVKTKTSLDLYICISVPLNYRVKVLNYRVKLWS